MKSLKSLKEAGKDWIKTTVTLIVVLTLCFLVITGAEIPDAFLIITTTIITYYFCVNERTTNNEKNLH